MVLSSSVQKVKFHRNTTECAMKDRVGFLPQLSLHRSQVRDTAQLQSPVGLSASSDFGSVQRMSLT
jgi:hypothetical protein